MTYFSTWPWTSVSQDSHALTPPTEVRANFIFEQPLIMLIKCLVPLAASMLNTKSVFNHCIRYLL